MAQPTSLFGYPWSRGIAGGIDVVIGLIGVVLLASAPARPKEKVTFNV
jgi:hypothetical protein